MNPRTEYAECDETTTRAFLTMFREIGDEFRFAIDSNVSEDEEVRAYLIKSNPDFNGRTTIGVTAINSKSRFETIKEYLTEMDLEIKTEQSQDKHESIGSYTAYTLEAYAEDLVDKDWNVPHLVVYGSLTPEIQEACSAVFGADGSIQFTDVRNHYLVFGENLDIEDRDSLCSQIQSSNNFFESDKRHAVSNIRTADIV